jgi:hypothetical protein
MLINYSNVARVHVALALWFKLKSRENPSLVFTGLGFDICVAFLRLLSKNIKDYVIKKKEFEDLNGLLVSFIPYFMIL